MAVCEILCVGTELLLGDILNTNARFLSKELALMGISVLRQTTVGDNMQRLCAAFNEAASRSDIVVACGGLGPTADDITKEALAQVLGLRLQKHEPTARAIEQYFQRRGVPMPRTNLKQALVPEGADVFENRNGSAPGIGVKAAGKTYVLLPGPPRELEPMFRDRVSAYLASYSDCVIISHAVKTFGIGESLMAEKVADLLELENPTVAPYAKDAEAYLRVTARAASREEAERLCAPVIHEIRRRLGSKVYGVDTENLQRRVVELLQTKGLKVAFAESCTGGYAAKRITDIPGSSAVFECGIVAYANAVKSRLLGVKPGTLKRFGAVSTQTAVEMAQGVLRISEADIGVGITGIAGPQSDTGGKPAGLCCIALAAKGAAARVETIETGRANDREYNRFAASSKALDMIRLYLEAAE